MEMETKMYHHHNSEKTAPCIRLTAGWMDLDAAPSPRPWRQLRTQKHMSSMQQQQSAAKLQIGGTNREEAWTRIEPQIHHRCHEFVDLLNLNQKMSPSNKTELNAGESARFPIFLEYRKSGPSYSETEARVARRHTGCQSNARKIRVPTQAKTQVCALAFLYLFRNKCS